ncbi:MAG: permease [Desulfobacterales bacterium SG8_35_2]|jgi:predicted PurR-regulated permease PerM|nr:MAG: permease [Desulfobacterales bacterium SG8_35_2]
METQPETEPRKPFSPLVFRYFLLLFLVSFLLLGRLLWPFFSILIISFLLTGLFQPVFRFFNERLRFSGQFSSLVTCWLIVLVVFVPLMIFVVALSKEVLGIYPLIKGKNLALLMQQLLEENQSVGRIKDIFAGFGIELHPERITAVFSEFGKVAGLFLYNQASAWAANIMNFVFSFFMMIIVIFFLLIDQEQFISYILDLSPLPDQQERQLFRKFEEIAKAVLVGNGLCGLLQGFLGGAAFMLLGISSPILWGGVMAILAFLPIFGIGLVLVPTAIVLFLKGSVGMGIFMLIFYVTLSFSVEYILKPWMVGERVKMHTLLVFLSILGGLGVYGVLGIIYGPLIVTTFLSLAEIYRKNYSEYVRKATC